MEEQLKAMRMAFVFDEDVRVLPRPAAPPSLVVFLRLCNNNNKCFLFS